MTTLSFYIVTFNCGRSLVQPEPFGKYLFHGSPNNLDPDFIVLNLQEIAPIGYGFLGGSFITPYYNAFRKSVKLAKDGYVNVVARNIGLTAIMIFAKKDVAANISWLQTAGVGLGLYEMGNKGAVGVRIGYEDTEFCFVSAHLAPMENALERRNEDFEGIVRRLIFISDSKPPGGDETREDAPLLQGTTSEANKGGMYRQGCHLFFAGDLNYRTSSTQPSEEDVNRFPQPTHDQKDPRHFSHLLEKDQLTQQVKARKTLQGLTEAAIIFPPTYKYKTGKAVSFDEDHWDWATHRWPSWCDRIFYSTSNIKVESYKALPLFGTSDHRPVAMAVSVPLKSLDDEAASAPFPLDNKWKSRRDAARRKEIVVGCMAYLTLTWEGNGLLLATIIGAIGGYLVLRSTIVPPA